MEQRIIAAINDSVLEYERSLAEGKWWKQPLAAFAAAGDSRFRLLPEVAAGDHLLPGGILDNAKTVVCFFIPFDERVAASNESAGAASPEWARAYALTNDLIKYISGQLAVLLGAEGFRAGQIPATHNFDQQRLASNWSHRHAARIAGLGSFGRNNMLITAQGCCGRLGSLVTDWEQPAGTTAPVFVEHCLHVQGKGCGLCRTKCPVNAYGESSGSGFDRHACYRRCLENAALYKNDTRFPGPILADVCGKCLCGLPCSGRSPALQGSADLFNRE
ncbi:MAG: hypothetical protein LBD48_02820 [Treponema sp.]|nr:hypothetical protein [Treponema sp.]